MIDFMPNENRFSRSKFDYFRDMLTNDLPKEYVDFLMKYNGGYVEDAVSVYHNNGEQKFLVTSLFGLGLESNLDLLNQLEIYKERVPLNCIPIARDAGGNIVCLNLSSDRYGNVYFWNHEKESDFELGKMTVNDLYFIANSFTEFFNTLEQDKAVDSELEGYAAKKAWIDSDFLKELEGDSDD